MEAWSCQKCLLFCSSFYKGGKNVCITISGLEDWCFGWFYVDSFSLEMECLSHWFRLKFLGKSFTRGSYIELFVAFAKIRLFESWGALKIQWRLIFGKVIRCSKIRLWLG